MKSPGTTSSPKHWLDAWHVNPSVNRDYDFIDGLRGIAILMVIAGHHVYTGPGSTPLFNFMASFTATGGHGVILFFALSGFLISWPFWKSKVAGSAHAVPRGYGWRRFWKIYPPLALSVILLTPFYMLFRPDVPWLALALKWLSGLPFLVPVNGNFNPVMWSLVVEVQFYLTLPLVFLLMKRLSVKAGFWLITLVFLAAPVAFHLVTGLSPDFRPDINSHFPAGLDAFYLGIMVAGLNHTGALGAGKKRAWLGDFGFVLLAAVISLDAWLGRHPGHSSFWLSDGLECAYKLASGCLLCYVADPQNPRARLLCQPWLRWCGIISYEWYLFHQPLAGWSRSLFGPASGHLVKYLLIIGCPCLFSLAVSALVYWSFSLPILKRGRSRAGKPRPV